MATQLRTITPEGAALGARLGRRLRPLAVATGIVISLGLPMTYSVLEHAALKRDARRHAQEIVVQLRSRSLDQILSDVARDPAIIRVRVLDASGTVLRVHERFTPSSWWPELRAPLAYAASTYDRDIRIVEVAVSQKALATVSAGLFLLSTVVGGAVALVTYFYPVRVVRGMERRVDALLTQQESLLETSRLLASTLDLQELLDRLSGIARSLPGIDVVRIWLRDEATGTLALQSHAGVRATDADDTREIRPGHGLIASVIETGRSLALRNVAADPGVVNVDWVRAQGIASYLGVPLATGDTPLGVLACMSRTPREWSRTEIALAETLGTLAAVAIRNARNFGELTRRGERLRRVADLSRTVSSSLDLDAVLQQVVAGVLALRPDIGCFIRLVDAEAEVYWIGAVGGFTQADLIPALPFGVGLTHVVAHTRAPLLVFDPANDPRTIPATRAVFGARTYYGVPIQAGDTLVGVLNIYFAANVTPTPAEREAIDVFAGQAAMAIRNARLFADSETRRRTAEALGEVGRALSQALDSRVVAGRIADGMCSLLRAKTSALFRLDAETGSLHGLALSGEAAPTLGPDTVLPRGNGVAGLAVSTREPAVTADLLNDPRITLTPELRATVERAGYAAVLVVPLMVGDRVIGALGAGDRAGRLFKADEIRLAQAFADQAALALDNAQLYENAQRAYEELSQTQAQLLRGETLRAMGELASGAAHHLNNLLAVVLGRLQLAHTKSPPPDIARHLELAEHAALDGAEVVRRMRGFSRGQPSQDLAPVELNRVAEDVLELTRPRWQDEAQVRGVRIEAHLDAGSIPPVPGDTAALREVLMNLILNAIDAMPNGGTITVRTWATRDAVSCEVADTGVGMSPEIQRRAVEPFFTTKGFHATGLGLSMNYGIIRRHGGDLVIESAVDQGTRVRFGLPLVAPALASPAPVATATAQAPLRILLIDDELEVRRVVAEMLALEAHEVVQAASGNEGIRILERDPRFDLVLTDLGMPDMTGWEVARAVKKMRPAIRVGLITGWGGEPAIKSEDRAAADFVLTKPISVEGLSAALGHAARDARSAAEPR